MAALGMDFKGSSPLDLVNLGAIEVFWPTETRAV
jgi:hypothetical protein